MPPSERAATQRRVAAGAGRATGGAPGRCGCGRPGGEQGVGSGRRAAAWRVGEDERNLCHLLPSLASLCPLSRPRCLPQASSARAAAPRRTPAHLDQLHHVYMVEHLQQLDLADGELVLLCGAARVSFGGRGQGGRPRLRRLPW
eukprot:360210-Chlamydomonas_euryale.AAC.8